jgi:hypothetical protein
MANVHGDFAIEITGSCYHGNSVSKPRDNFESESIKDVEHRTTVVEQCKFLSRVTLSHLNNLWH